MSFRRQESGHRSKDTTSLKRDVRQPREMPPESGPALPFAGSSQQTKNRCPQAISRRNRDILLTLRQLITQTAWKKFLSVGKWSSLHRFCSKRYASRGRSVSSYPLRRYLLIMHIIHFQDEYNIFKFKYLQKHSKLLNLC